MFCLVFIPILILLFKNILFSVTYLVREKHKKKVAKGEQTYLFYIFYLKISKNGGREEGEGR